MATTMFVVLKQDDRQEDTWHEIGRERAHNRRQAISLCLLAKQPHSVAREYKAVPERNWQSEFPGVERVQKVVFGSTLAEADAE